MLTDSYIEALLLDEGLADQVWEAWDKGEIDDQVAWWLITLNAKQTDNFLLRLGDNNDKAKAAQRRRGLILRGGGVPCDISRS